MSYDFALDTETNDLILTNNLFEVTNTNENLLRQRLGITLKAWVGEWFLNESFGIPYRQKIFAGVVSKEEVDAEFLNVISAYEEVNFITSFSSTTDSATRSYSLTFTVNTDEGEETFALFIKSPWEEVVYPPADTTPEELDILYFNSIADINSIIDLQSIPGG